MVTVEDQSMALCHFLDLIFVESFKQIAFLPSKFYRFDDIDVAINRFQNWLIIVGSQIA